MSIDHVIPASHGGLLILNNVSLAHKTCNRARGVKSFYRHRELMAAELGIAPTDEPQLYLPREHAFQAWMMWCAHERFADKRLEVTATCRNVQRRTKASKRRRMRITAPWPAPEAPRV